MDSILEKVEGLNNVIRALQKIESRQRNGQIIDAHRHVNALIADMEYNKRAIINAEKMQRMNTQKEN